LINREVLTKELHELDTRISLNAQRQSDIFASLKGVGTSIPPEELAGLNEEMEILQDRRLTIVKELRARPKG
jgi:hypothetical protein